MSTHKQRDEAWIQILTGISLMMQAIQLGISEEKDEEKVKALIESLNIGSRALLHTAEKFNAVENRVMV